MAGDDAAAAAAVAAPSKDDDVPSDDKKKTSAIDADENEFLDCDELPEPPEERQSVLLDRLSAGFRALRRHRDSGPSDTTTIPLSDLTPDFLSYALVNFIDPTSSSGPFLASSSSPTGAAAAGGKLPGMLSQKPPLELYQKLSTIFQKEYKSTLRNVPYTHLRNRGGAPGTIRNLPVKIFLTRTAGGLIMDDDMDDLPWGGTGSGGLVLGAGDPSEWHAVPFCHVYLAACESLEHYRNKVKPAIQAFLSQIEATAKPGTGAAINKGEAVSSTPYDAGKTSQYVIVFCPTGDNKAQEEQGKMASWTSRVRRMAREASADNAASSSAQASDSGEFNDVDDGTITTTTSTATSSSVNATAHLSKIDREIARRFAVDFSAGKVCTLSTLIGKEGDSKHSNDELKRLEWREFLNCLSAAIGDGFCARCQRYDVELRQQDSLRALEADGSARARVIVARQRQKFDVTKFFLVKESLAFTYEQMCLPSEALLQYDELRAVLPELNACEADGNDKSMKKMNPNAIVDEKLSEIALQGDCVGFRRKLRTIQDLNSDPAIAAVLQQYLLSRETSLLFKMNNAVVAAERCMAFVKSMYEYKNLSRQLKELEERQEDQKGDVDEDAHIKSIVEVERWAFEFCWDVKTACDIYLADDVTESQYDFDDRKQRQRPRSKTRKNDEALARFICDLLEFARLRFMKIGDLFLESGNPVRTYPKQVNAILSKKWKPWSPLSAKHEDESFHEDDFDPMLKGDFIQDALRSSDTYLTRYLELLKVMVGFNRFSGRRRCAARLAVEVAGIYVVKGSPEGASLMIREAARVYAQDQWHSCQFMLLFRLASYQRDVSTADDYIDTLVQCFSPYHTKSAPPKALDYLLNDLEKVLHCSLGSRTRLAGSPIFQPLLGVDGYDPSQRAGSVRDLLKKVYSVGDRACVTLSLTSFLPREIEAEDVSVELVPFKAYIAAMEDSTVVKDEDVFLVLHQDGPIKISTGLNELTFPWVPMASGQFILSTTVIKWKGVRFSYTVKDQKRPTIRVDIVPSEPTQSVKLSPDYIIPGHEQPVKLIFQAGSDIVESGTIKLSCTSGLLLLPPLNCEVFEKTEEASEAEKWSSSCECVLPACSPQGTYEMTVTVKTRGSESDAPHQTVDALGASVTTSYRCPHPEGPNAGVSEGPCMNHAMETKVCALEKSALSVESMEVVNYDLDRSLLNFSLKCNTPAPVVIKSWKISLPSFLELAEDGDTNDCLSETRIGAGEVISMAFGCIFTENVSDDSSESQELVIQVEDEFGRIFPENLPLGLKRPTATRVSLPPLQPVSVETVPSSDQGLVGEPIRLLYKVDAGDILSVLASSAGVVHYRLVFQDGDWIVSGKSEGVVHEREQHALEFVAIPVRPGVIECFPELSLSFRSEDAAAAEVPLQVSAGASAARAQFRSCLPPVNTAVAVPTQTGKMQSRSSFVA